MPQVVVLERVEPEHNVHRYYVLAGEPTLFDDMALRREWGRLGHRGGAWRLDLHASAEEAKEALASWLKRKRRRGYSVALHGATKLDLYLVGRLRKLPIGGRFSSLQPAALRDALCFGWSADMFARKSILSNFNRLFFLDSPSDSESLLLFD